MAKEEIRNASDAEQEQGNTGIPAKVSDAQQNRDITAQYTSDDDQLAEGVRELHPNRNVDKEDATGAGGYRN